MTLKRIFVFWILVCAVILPTISCAPKRANIITRTKTESEQSMLTPWQALQKLKIGNDRFITGAMRQRNLAAQVASSQKQYPFAVILNCMDSRGPPEIIFDQGIGDIFAERLAGNIINSDVLGGMEFGTKISGAKLIVVLGHTSCGAVKGACQHAELGNLTGLLEKIKPAISKVEMADPANTCDNVAALNEMSKENMRNAIMQIQHESPVIMDLIKSRTIGLVGGMHDLTTGKVTFFEDRTLLPGSP
jgi:carbonic anhydrase